MNTISNLIFDLGNVIIDLDETRTWSWFSQRLVEKDMSAFMREDVLNYEKGLFSSESLINRVQRASQMALNPIDIKKGWNAMLLSIPNARMTMLKKLMSKFNVYILSNTNALHLEWVYDWLKREYDCDDFAPLYAHASFYSNLMHLRKPDLDIYKTVLDETGSMAGETLFFDDKFENLTGAQRLGIKTHLVIPGEEIAETVENLRLLSSYTK